MPLGGHQGLGLDIHQDCVALPWARWGSTLILNQRGAQASSSSLGTGRHCLCWLLPEYVTARQAWGQPWGKMGAWKEIAESFLGEQSAGPALVSCPRCRQLWRKFFLESCLKAVVVAPSFEEALTRMLSSSASYVWFPHRPLCQLPSSTDPSVSCVPFPYRPLCPQLHVELLVIIEKSG